MSRKLISVLLIVISVHLGSVRVYADPQQKSKQTHADRIKAAVARMGSGLETRIVVTLRHTHARVEGYISEIKEDSFSITDQETGITLNIPYWTVRSLSAFNINSKVQVSVSDHAQVVLYVVATAASITAAIIFAKIAASKLKRPNLVIHK